MRSLLRDPRGDNVIDFVQGLHRLLARLHQEHAKRAPVARDSARESGVFEVVRAPKEGE